MEKKPQQNPQKPYDPNQKGQPQKFPQQNPNYPNPKSNPQKKPGSGSNW